MRRITTFILASLLVAIAAGVASGAQSDPPGLQKAIAAQEAHTDALLARSGVVGTAVGRGSDGRGAVLVLLENPGVSGIPANLDGVAVVRLVTGRITALHHRNGHGGGPGGGDPPPPPEGECSSDTTARNRPACHGHSVGHPAITAGTIGARVTDNSGNVYILSNNHVLADVNAASVGDAIIQPGTFDGGSSPADDIGTLDDYEPIDFAAGASNVMDAAIASVAAADLLNTTPSDGYGVPKSTTLAAAINMKVQKYGRTTGQTQGQIAGINATVNVDYGPPNGPPEIATFTGQIIITPGTFSAGGDSGSLIVAKGRGRDKSNDRKPVGLLFAGSSTVTIASPIGPILARFNVTIDGN